MKNKWRNQSPSFKECQEAGLDAPFPLEVGASIRKQCPNGDVLVGEIRKICPEQVVCIATQDNHSKRKGDTFVAHRGQIF